MRKNADADAQFPFERTGERFSFSFEPSMDKQLVQKVSTLAFVPDSAIATCLGPPGVDRPQLAVALGIKAIDAEFAVYLLRAHHFLKDFWQAPAEHRLDRRRPSTCRRLRC